MSSSDLYWLKYPVATLVLVAFVAVLGIPAYLVVRRRLPDWAAILVPNLGLAWAILLVSWYARLGTALHWWVVWGAFVTVAVVLVVLAARAGLGRELRAKLGSPREAGSVALSFAAPWLLGVTAVTLFMLPMISSPFLSNGFVTSFTFTNADLGSYVGQATNLVKAGFADSGFYFGWNPGSDPSTLAAKTDHTGANALLALSSATLGAPVWKVAQLSIMLAFAATFVAATALVRALLPRSPRGALVIAAVGTTSFMIWYLVGNFFLAHVICLALVLSQLAVLVAARDRLLDWRVLFTLVPLAAATWLTSPELQLVFVLLAGALIGADLVASLITRVPGTIRSTAERAAAVGLSVIVAALVIFPFTADLIARSRRVYASDGVVGWSIELQNGALTLLGHPDGIGTRSDLGWIALTAAGLLLAACLTWALVRRDRLGILSGVVGVVLVAGSAFGALRWGWGTYQSWKLILSLSAPFLIFAAILVLRPLSPQNRRAALAVFAGIAIVNIAAGARMWDPFRASPQAVAEHSVNSALTTVLRQARVQDQDRLNMYVPTFHLTMIAPSIYEKRAAMSSPSYVSGGGPGEHPYSCSLVAASLYKRKMGKIVYTSHGYHLVATPRCA